MGPYMFHVVLDSSPIFRSGKFALRLKRCDEGYEFHCEALYYDPSKDLAPPTKPIGGGTDEQIEAIGKYFEGVGLAFQIMDDVLNLRGLYFGKADQSVEEDAKAKIVEQIFSRDSGEKKKNKKSGSNNKKESKGKKTAPLRSKGYEAIQQPSSCLQASTDQHLLVFLRSL